MGGCDGSLGPIRDIPPVPRSGTTVVFFGEPLGTRGRNCEQWQLPLGQKGKAYVGHFKIFFVPGGADVHTCAANSGIKKRLGVDHVNTASVHINRGGGSRLQQHGHAKTRTCGNRSDRHCKPASSPASCRDTLALRQQYQRTYLSRAGSWLRGEGSALCPTPPWISGTCLRLAQSDAAPRFGGFSCARTRYERLWSHHRVG